MDALTKRDSVRTLKQCLMAIFFSVRMLQGDNGTPMSMCKHLSECTPCYAWAFMCKYQLRNSTGTRYHLGAKPWNYQSSFRCKTLGRLLLPLSAAWYTRFSGSPISDIIKLPCTQKTVAPTRQLISVAIYRIQLQRHYQLYRAPRSNKTLKIGAISFML